nr:coiled-coil domain-containing protein 170 [Onthophagus taurus]
MEQEEVDVTTALRSDLAALQFKKDRLTEELSEMKCQYRTREQRCMEMQLECDQLREQAARQNAVIQSLKKRLVDLEERERNLYATQGRNEIALQTLQRDNKYQEDRVKELEKKIRNLELDLSSEEQKKESARNAFQDLIRRLSITLGADNVCDSALISIDSLIHKASELVQEISRLRSKSHSCTETLTNVEIELRQCKEHLERVLDEKECIQRQNASQMIEIDRLRQEKETGEMHQRVADREIIELKDKLVASTRSLGSAGSNIAQQEANICQLKDDLKIREEKLQRIQHEHRQGLESFAALLSTPGCFIECCETAIRDRIRDLVTENKDKCAQLEALREKLSHDSSQLGRQVSMYEQLNSRVRTLEEEKCHLEARLHKADTEINSCEVSREGLKRDKTTFMNFLERLARALNMEEISHDVGVELHTESLLLRAEQLARLESDKLVDKLLCCGYGTLPRLRRERSFHDLPSRETATVYQLQRRLRTLREQVQRKDLHLDLLRRKLSLQEDNAKAKCLLQSERDEASIRIRKLMKQLEKVQIQFADSKSQIRELNAQLAEAADFKITALERARKIEELQKRLIESEALRTKYNRKVSMLKDQVRNTGDTIEQERSMNEHSIQLLRDDLARMKESLSELNRRESQLLGFRSSVAKILGCILPMPDYELISRLQKLVDAHHDFTIVSRRYDDPVLRMTSRSPTGGSRCTTRCTPDRSRYDDSGYTDAADIDDIDDDLFKRRGNL